MPAETCVLAVEDDNALRRSLVLTLKAAGYQVVEAERVDAGMRAIAHHRPDLILLDLGLPDGEGFDLIAKVRESALTPIVVISARDAESSKVAALDAGADDYVTKPFGVDELLARVRAALRHGVQSGGSPPVVRTGGLDIDLGGRVVRREGEEIDLTPKEYEILALLASNLGKVVRHRDMLKTVWGSDHADIQYLRVYVGQLRAKLGAAGALIVSDPGVGYRLLASPPPG